MKNAPIYLRKLMLVIQCVLDYGSKEYTHDIFRYMYEDENFFKKITELSEGEASNFSVTSWRQDENQLWKRKMHYEFPKTVAFTKYTVCTDQEQTKCTWSNPGLAYGVDVVSTDMIDFQTGL